MMLRDHQELWLILQVTYRLLSRELKIHVNTAKESVFTDPIPGRRMLTGHRMLFEFHRLQNGKKPGTIHATYLVSGTKRKDEAAATNGSVKKDGEDEYMQSSPFMNSSMPQVEESTGETSVLSISLTGEENLDSMYAWRTPLRTLG